ncbi:hypothetical protein BH23PAT2_BH23PAT2_06550 [soil metagenome]
MDIKNPPIAEQLVQPEDKKPNYRLRRAGAAVLIGLVGLGGAKVADGVLFEPDRERNEAEATIIEEMRNGERPTKIKPAVIVLRPGTKIREQPERTSSDVDMSNVESQLDGESLVIYQPLTHVDDLGNTWYGFKIGERVAEPSTTAVVGPAQTSSEVGASMSWVDMTTLESQVNKETGQPYAVSLPISSNGQEETMTATINSSGAVTVGTETGSGEVAVAQSMDVPAAELLVRLLSQ